MAQHSCTHLLLNGYTYGAPWLRCDEALWEPFQLFKLIVSMAIIGSFDLELSVAVTVIYEASFPAVPVTVFTRLFETRLTDFSYHNHCNEYTAMLSPVFYC